MLIGRTLPAAVAFVKQKGAETEGLEPYTEVIRAHSLPTRPAIPSRFSLQRKTEDSNPTRERAHPFQTATACPTRFVFQRPGYPRAFS